MRIIENKTFDEERALYNLTDASVLNCTFAGPQDGESAFKEARNIKVSDCRFSLRYPFWHIDNFEISGCNLDELTRASLWYAQNGKVYNCLINGVKCLRECKDIEFANVVASSPEFGWKCDNITIKDCNLTSEYFLFESSNINIENLKMQGKYSFQYIKNSIIKNSVLNTKDAFWHAENIVVENCEVRGEYLGWYSKGLTFINCKISGTQPLCYCENLKLINCTMEDTDLSFEYSEVEADIKGNILSVKNPKSGEIKADSITEIITDNSIMESTCKITIR